MNLIKTKLLQIFRSHLAKHQIGNVDLPMNFTFKEFHWEDFQNQEILSIKNRSNQFKTRCSHGYRVFGIINNNQQIVSYAWVTENFDMASNKHQIYIWDCRTSSNYQNQGLYRKVLRHIQSKFYNEGACSATIACETFNAASIKGIKAANFVEDYKVLKIRLPKYTVIVKDFKHFQILSNTTIPSYF